MRKPTRGEGAVLGTALFVAGLSAGYGVYESNKGPEGQGGDKPTEAKESAEATAARVAWEKKMDEVMAARRAIANRYAGCSITKRVVDTHTAEVYDEFGTEAGKSIPRNKVTFTVEADKNPEAVEAEAKYAAGTPDAGLVKWSPFDSAPRASLVQVVDSDTRSRGDNIPTESSIVSDTPAGTVYSVTMYPRVDEKRTETAEISLQVGVETTDVHTQPGTATTYVAEGIRSCGILYEDVDISDPAKLEPGPLTWQVSQSGAEGFEEFTLNEYTR